MTLDDILKGVEKREHLTGIDRALETPSGATAPETYNAFAQFLQTYLNYSQDRAQTVVKSPEMTVKQAREDIAEFRVGTEMQLAHLVQSEYGGVLAAIPNEKLEEFAIMSLPGKDKNYLPVHNALASEDIDGVRQLLIDNYKDDPYWAKVMMRSGKETVAKFAMIYIDEARTKFINKNLSDETSVVKEGKTKKEYKINYDKVRAYIRDTIGALADPREKMKAYNALAGCAYMAKKAKKSK